MKIMEKINKKTGDYRLSAAVSNKRYSFVIDGSFMNGNSTETKWFVSNFKMALKKYLLSYDIENALKKSLKYMKSNFKNYYKVMPLISLGICKKNDDKLEVFVLNGVRAYIKENKIITVSDKKFFKANNKILSLFKDKNSNLDNLKGIIKDTDFRKIYKSLNFENGEYYKTTYEKAHSILLCNEGFYNYQKYLELDDSVFYDLVTRQGVKYCYHHLKRIEDNDLVLVKLPRLKIKDDIVAVCKILI